MTKKHITLQRFTIPGLIISILTGVLLWSHYQVSTAAQPTDTANPVLIQGRLYPQGQAMEFADLPVVETLPSPPISAPKTVTPSTPATVINTPEPEVVVSAPTAIDVKLTIQQPNKKSQWSFQVVENSTVDAAMRWASGQYQFSYVTKQFSGLGSFVDELNGVKSDSATGMYWLYYVNGTPAATGVSSYILHAGDTITWKYQKS